MTYDVAKWLAKHKRFHLHFTPTSSSWLNLVERWFRDLDDKAIRRGMFASVPDLITAIEAYLDADNHDPTPLVWTADAQSILGKVHRARQTLEAIASQKRDTTLAATAHARCRRKTRRSHAARPAARWAAVRRHLE
jgi:hypothetical protein